MKTNQTEPKRHAARQFFVKIGVESGYLRVCFTRYGRWFASIDAAERLAAQVGGEVWKRLPNGTDVRFDPLAGLARASVEGDSRD